MGLNIELVRKVGDTLLKYFEEREKKRFNVNFIFKI